jgi:hypothetical protein
MRERAWITLAFGLLLLLGAGAYAGVVCNGFADSKVDTDEENAPGVQFCGGSGGGCSECFDTVTWNDCVVSGIDSTCDPNAGGGGGGWPPPL